MGSSYNYVLGRIGGGGVVRFKVNDVIRCNYGNHESFAIRRIIGTDQKGGKYVTKFLEDNTIADSSIKVIDSLYDLAEYCSYSVK